MTQLNDCISHFTHTLGMILYSFILAVLGAIYIISPIDAIPDFIPILGWADDAGVFGFVVKQLFLTYCKKMAWQLIIIPGTFIFGGGCLMGYWEGWIWIGIALAIFWIVRFYINSDITDYYD